MASLQGHRPLFTGCGLIAFWPPMMHCCRKLALGTVTSLSGVPEGPAAHQILLFLKHVRHIPTTGPLHHLFSLLRTPFSQYTWIHLLLWVELCPVNVTLFGHRIFADVIT